MRPHDLDFGSRVALKVADRSPVRAVLPRREIGVQALLEWAFAVECARVEFDELGRGAGVGLEYVLMMRAMQGEVDCSRGWSSPASDAEIVASVVSALPEALGGRRMALTVAELARSRRVPDAMIGARPSCEPVAWARNGSGWMARTEDCGVVVYRSGCRVYRTRVRCCPVRYATTRREIARAQRGWLAWWGALRHLRESLRHAGLARHALTDEMPPMRPWE